jgi:hypothetical protein
MSHNAPRGDWSSLFHEKFPTMNYQWFSYTGLDGNIGFAANGYALAIHIASSGGQAGKMRNKDRSEVFARLLVGLRDQVPTAVVLAARLGRSDTPLIRLGGQLQSDGASAGLEDAFKRGTTFRFDFWLKCSTYVEVTALAAALGLVTTENTQMEVTWPNDSADSTEDGRAAEAFRHRFHQLIAEVENPSHTSMTKWWPLEEFVATAIDLDKSSVVASYVSDMKQYGKRFTQKTEWLPVRIMIAADDQVAGAMRAKFEDVANGKQKGSAETIALVAHESGEWRICGIYSGVIPFPETAARLSKAAGLALPQRLDDERSLAESLYVPLEWLRDVLWLIEDKKAVVFYGPPGTGKTFIAQRIAEFIQPTQDLRSLVQMHPSYGYEEFFEGFRPDVDSDGQMRLKKNDGPLKKLIATANQRDDRAVLILDEMNRGNLPRVFGELYFLLEYRDKHAPLMYSPGESFSLPDDFTIMGTMNTADRSVALLDQALRRRFHFVPLFPGTAAVDGMLRRYLQSRYKGSMNWVADMLAAANAKLDRNVAVGPSHFMRPDLDKGKVRRIWDHTVMPTIEEFYFGQETRLEEFAFESLCPRTDSDTTPSFD